MGPAHPDFRTLASGRRQTDRTNRSLIATAAIVAIAALIACWFGTREVTNGIVNYEARESARDWAASFSHSLAQANADLPPSALRPYSKATSPERFKALDNAMFDGAILSYRLYSIAGVIVASSNFEEIGKAVKGLSIGQVIDRGNSHAYATYTKDSQSAGAEIWTATALAPLSRGSDTIGIFEVTVDVSDRAKQLNRLRYLAFSALTALLVAIFGILGFSLSRTLKKQREAQQALASSERQHRRLLDDAPDSMVIHNLDEVLYVNAAAVALHGAASQDELIGLDPIELVPESARGDVQKKRQQALSVGEIQKTALVGRRRLDGTDVETDTIGMPIRWNGESCLLIQSRDVTAQHAAQKEIAHREAQFSAFMENSPAVMFIKSLDGRLVMVNRQFENFYGMEKERVIGLQTEEWAEPDLVDAFASEDRDVAASGGPISLETLITRADGKKRLMRYEKFPICDGDNRIVGIGCISTDITDIQEREEQSRRSKAEAERAKAQLSAFLDNSPSPMYLKDHDRNLTMVNRAFENFYGVTSADVVGHPIRDWKSGGVPDDIDTIEMAVFDLGESMDIEIETENADGESRTVVVSKFPVFAPDGAIVGIGGVNTDVTEARRQEAEVRQTQARLAAYIDHIPMMVVLMDRESRFLMVNSRYEAFFDVSADDIAGNIGHDHISDEYQETCQAENRRVCDFQETIERVVEMRNAAGRTRLLLQTKFPIATGEGLPVAVGVVLSDITDQKQHERDLEKARDDAEAANRAKSAFLANMSHEIRTPMNGVFGMADLLAQSPLTTDQQRYLNTIRRSGEALLGVINDVLDVSRVEAGEFQLDVHTFNLHDLIAEAVELYTETASAKGVFIAHNIAATVPVRVEGDPVRLRQVLTNLVGNAIKFTTDGSVVVRVARIGGDATNSVIRFEVSDTGIGIERGKLATLFEPFQQADSSVTRRFGGSGLGLSIAGHIVGLMGGHIDIDSEPGKGSSFVFSISMAVDTSKNSPRSSKREALAGKRLLIVDDNGINREILTDFARDWDTEFVAAANAEDAQAAIRSAANAKAPFDVALIDIVMPGMDGMALAEWIGEHDTAGKTKLVGLTSFNWHHDAEASRTAGFCRFATKPIRRTDLANMISDVLNDIRPAENDTPDQRDIDDRTESASGYSASVLLAEDNEVNREIAHEYLVRLGCAVTMAENGRQAVDRFVERPFDIVLMDVQMPEMDGIEATSRIRDIEAETGSRRTPIVAATAHAFQEDREKCIVAGMDDFLSKPYTNKDIEPVLERWLGPRDTRAEHIANPAFSETRNRNNAPDDTLDDGVIAQLRSLDTPGEDSVFRKVASLFLESTPTQLEQLGALVEADDFTGMALIAHSLKTSAANVAALGLSDLFRALESAARDGNSIDCARLTCEISDMYDVVSTALQVTAGVDAPQRRTA